MRWAIGFSMLAVGLAAQELTIPMEPGQIQRLGIALVQPEKVLEIALGEAPAVVTVPPQAEALVSAPVAGRIEEVRVARGEVVAARQPVARLHSPELLAQEKRLLDAWQELNVAQAGYLREKPLFEEGIIAKSRFLETEKRWRQAQIAYAQAQAELETVGMSKAAIAHLVKTARLSGRLELTAPLTGVVTAREVTVGQWVDRLAPVLRITATDQLWLEMAVPVALAERLRPGTLVRIESQRASGQVISIGGAVDPATQTVLVRAQLTDPQGLQPGRKVVAAFRKTLASPLIKLPRSALIDHQGGQFVFVRVPEGFRAQQVRVAAKTQEEVFLAGGVDPSAQVVSQGTAALKAAWLGGEEE